MLDRTLVEMLKYIQAEKKAIEKSIEQWTWLAETGKKKQDWPEWEKYDDVSCNCFLCEYNEGTDTDESCGACPLYKKFGNCENEETPYMNWLYAKTPEDRKKYALEFLEQLKQL